MNPLVTATGSTPAGLPAPVALAAAAGELASSTPSCSGPVFDCVADGTVVPDVLAPVVPVVAPPVAPAPAAPVVVPPPAGPGTVPSGPGTPCEPEVAAP